MERSIPTLDLFAFFKALYRFDRGRLFLGTWEVEQDGGRSFSGESGTLGKPPELNLFDGQNCRIDHHLYESLDYDTLRFVNGPLNAEWTNCPIVAVSGELLFKRLAVLNSFEGTVLRRRANPEYGISECRIRSQEELIIDTDDPFVHSAIDYLTKGLTEGLRKLYRYRPNEDSPYQFELYVREKTDPCMFLRALLAKHPEVIKPYRWDANSIDPVDSKRVTVPLDRSHLVHPRSFASVSWDELLRLAAFYVGCDEEQLLRWRPGQESVADVRITLDGYLALETSDWGIVQALEGFEFLSI